MLGSLFLVGTFAFLFVLKVCVFEEDSKLKVVICLVLLFAIWRVCVLCV